MSQRSSQADLSISAVVPKPSAETNSAAVPFASTPAAMPWPNLTLRGSAAPPGPRPRHTASTAAAAGPPISRIQASATSGSAADPGSHGSVASLLSPRGATAYMTTPNSRPVPAPIASVPRVTWDRREVRNKMTPRYAMVISRSGISPAQAGPPVDLPSTPLQPWMLLQPWAIQKVYRYAGRAGVRLANVSTMYRPGRRARMAAQQRTRRDRPARLGLGGPKNRRASSGSPASSSTVAITWNWLTAAWPTPGCGQAAQAVTAAAAANSKARTSRRGISASRASTQGPAGPPGQPRQSRRHLVRLGPDRRAPLPPPGGQQPHRGAPARSGRLVQPVHGTTPATAPRTAGVRAALAAFGLAALASAPVALASPAAVSRYR